MSCPGEPAWSWSYSRPSPLKLQLLVQMADRPMSTASSSSTEQVGTVLSWDPATGSLQLSQAATRQLMASLGGRYHARRDRDLTVFFPVAPPQS